MGTLTLKMLGKTITSVTHDKSAAHDRGSEQVVFHFGDGTCAVMEHSQNCCESVTLEEIIGDFNDLVGNPLLRAELRTSDDNPKDPEDEYNTHTWSFYEFSTIKGSVTLRWFGISNGYYSETVDVYYYDSFDKFQNEKGYSCRVDCTEVDFGFDTSK